MLLKLKAIQHKISVFVSVHCCF